MLADYASVARTERDRRATLRVAAYRADWLGLVAALSALRWDDALQLAGDGLVVALAQEVDRAPELARRFVEALRERAWDGDDLLAERLEAALGDGPLPLLRPVPVDLEELSETLEGDPDLGGGQIDLRTGTVWPEAALDVASFDDEDEEEDDDDRWLVVSPEGSDAGYRDMADFIGTIADSGRANRLSMAISGRGPFRRFKDVLAGWPDDLERWYAFSEERRMGRARVWLAEAGYMPTHTTV
jgi:hypothetical protein